MAKPTVELIDELLKEEQDRCNGALPDLVAIAWRGTLAVIVGDLEFISIEDYDQLRHYFEGIKDDPVSYIVRGVHSLQDAREHEEKFGPGEWVHETLAEQYEREIKSDTRHFGGKLDERFAVAWRSYLYPYHEWKVLTDDEYAKLLALIPEVKNNPLDRIKADINNPDGEAVHLAYLHEGGFR